MISVTGGGSLFLLSALAPNGEAWHDLVISFKVFCQEVERIMRECRESRPWHHSPAHRFIPGSAYIVTGGTLYKRHFFNSDEVLEMLQNVFFDLVKKYRWMVDAWAFFSNHYHFVAHAPEDASTLKLLIQELYSTTSEELNRRDTESGRQVWFQYWDTCLSYQPSYFARLNYVHNNPVKHRLAKNAEDYRFCSARWFRQNANPSYFRRVSSYGCSRVKIVDDF